MIPGQRSPVQTPGDLYLDPAVPAAERIAVSCGSWSAEATHVWTGAGWARLHAGPVREVPASAALDPVVAAGRRTEPGVRRSPPPA